LDRETGQIVVELEKCVRPWMKPWNADHLMRGHPPASATVREPLSCCVSGTVALGKVSIVFGFLPVPYFHVVFTLPAKIGAIAYQNKAKVYGLLFSDGRDAH
jgi:hypothetical protein